jgi:hypothetical protein
MSIFFCILSIALLSHFETKEGSPTSSLQMLLIGCLGACGALLSTRLGLEQVEVSSTAAWDGAAKMFYSAAVGAPAAVIIALFPSSRRRFPVVA